MKKTAQILSILFHPYLLPLYGGLLVVSYSFLEILPLAIKVLIVGGIFLFSGVLPMLFHLTLSLFYWNKSDKKPYVRLTEILLYTVFLFFAAFYMHRLSLPFWVESYLAGAGLTSAIVWIVNVTGWRISFFMSSLGALMGLVIVLLIAGFPIPIVLFVLLIAITGMVGTARQLLDRNALAQILTGWASGIIAVLVVMLLIQRHLLPYL